jgi:acetylornithine deacetylase/succinyl-diaminopimelate desuccinylase-like protein
LTIWSQSVWHMPEVLIASGRVFGEVTHAPGDKMSAINLESVYSRIDRDKKRHVDSMRRLLMQPSSSQEDIGIDKCAELVAAMYRRAGCENVEIIETKGNPIVYGDCKGASDNTLLGYFMYDTMPYNEPGWNHPAMGAKIVDMKLPAGKVKAIVNRGSDNTKGPLAAFLNSVEACNKSEGRPPVGLQLVAEGEEELGSPNLPVYVKMDKKRLSRSSACYFPYFAQDGDGAVNLYLGVKGVVYFELECSGKSWGRGPQDFAIHSGNKAWVDSPVWRLIDALSTMVSDNGSKVLIDGFYDDIAPPTEEDEEIIRDSAKSLDPEATKVELNIKRFMIPETDRTALIKQYTYASTLNIDGIWGGWIEKGSKTILPHKATCKIDIRVVPNQSKDKMMPLVRKHLDAHGYRDIKMTEIDTGYDWCRSSVKEPVVQSIINSLTEFGGRPAIWPTSGGSVPFFVFNRVLKLPFAMGGLGHSNLAHSPNEYMVIEGTKKIPGLAEIEKFMVHFMDQYGRSS